MTMARRKIFGAERRGVFHCMTRCVRRAFLCGEDGFSGKNFDHRKEWIRDRLGVLARSFGIDVLTYAVMSNHVHVVLRTRPDQVQRWDSEEVARRWLSVFVPRHLNEDGEAVYEVLDADVLALQEDADRIAEIRERLSSLSWFMKALNEYISRKANREDGCRGRFWESRFKSQRLEGEASVLACMCYVDLNPVRAKLAEGLEDSLFTGAYDRIMAEKAQSRLDKLTAEERVPQLVENEKLHIERNGALTDLSGAERPFHLLDETGYLKLLDWTGRQLRRDKPGMIAPETRTLLEGLELDADEWVSNIQRYNTLFGAIAGTLDELRAAAENLGKRWLKGCGKAGTLFRTPEPAAC